LIVEGRNVGSHARRGLIKEVHSGDGSPPYLVRWSDSDQECLTFPGPDAHIVAAVRK
jgi:hypothetical protein